MGHTAPKCTFYLILMRLIRHIFQERKQRVSTYLQLIWRWGQKRTKEEDFFLFFHLTQFGTSSQTLFLIVDLTHKSPKFDVGPTTASFFNFFKNIPIKLEYVRRQPPRNYSMYRGNKQNWEKRLLFSFPFSFPLLN